LLDQLDATIMIYWWTNNSTCFGHHCAHLQECKAVHYCIWFSTLIKVLAGVLGRREAGRVHCVKAVFRLSSVQPCTPEDGHSGARNMLSYWFINHNCCIKLV